MTQLILLCVYADRQHQMPHFAQTDLMTKYGYTERLRYTYYLKQARPSFAFLAFIAEEKESDVDISAQRLVACVALPVQDQEQ